MKEKIIVLLTIFAASLLATIKSGRIVWFGGSFIMVFLFLSLLVFLAWLLTKKLKHKTLIITLTIIFGWIISKFILSVFTGCLSYHTFPYKKINRITGKCEFTPRNECGNDAVWYENVFYGEVCWSQVDELFDKTEFN